MKKKWNSYLILFSLCSLSLTLGAETLERKFQSPEELKGISFTDARFAGIVPVSGGTSVLELSVPKDADPKQTKNVLIWRPDVRLFRNRRVVFSVEMKLDLSSPVNRWDGGHFSVWAGAPEGQKGIWANSSYIGIGKTGWKRYRFEVDFPDFIRSVQVTAGIAGARGNVRIRNLTIETGDVLLTLNHAVNMGFADRVSGDRKGGWHDQGPDRDASKFPIARKTFANVPFKIIDPKKNHEKSIVVFECPRLPSGPKSVPVEFSFPVKGRYLYLLHASAWGQTAGSRVGCVEFLDADGVKKTEIPILYGKDLTDWWGAKGVENAVVGTPILARGGYGAAYVTRLAIPKEAGAFSKIIFRKEPGSNAMWMLIGGTVSDTKYRYPESRSLVIREDAVWKAIPQSVRSAPQKGTALDFSALFPKDEIGKYGRLIVGKTGHFEFEKRPGIPVRFNSFSMGREFGPYFTGVSEISDRASIEAYADQVERAGFNMIRIWPQSMRTEAWRTLKAFEFSEKHRDLFDYLLFCLRKKGIYVYVSLPIPTAGYDYCYPWGGPQKAGWSLYLNKKDFEAWCRATEMVLTHVNPYTKMRWIDDPQIALIDFNNELEFVFLRADDRYAGLFRTFLEKKYKEFSKLKKVWGRDADRLHSFADIRTFHPLGNDKPGQLSRDRADFVTEQERSIYAKEKEFITKLGYRGPTTTFLMGSSMRHVGVRKSFDFVSKNGYHDHPSSGAVVPRTRISQASSIGSAANTVRTFLSGREYGKPFLVSEHGHCFWNKYRYEHGFVLGGYAALNGFDALTAFMMPVTTNQNRRIVDFEIRFDPVRRATELMTSLLFLRGDVKPSDIHTRIRMDLADVIQTGAVTDAVNASQLRMGLLGRCSVDQSNRPYGEKDIRMNRIGSSATAIRKADNNVVDTKERVFDMNRLVRDLKQRGLLEKSNRTDAENEQFESSTGELFLDGNRNRMTIDTPRFQGLCGEAGSTGRFQNFEVRSMNRRGSIALASIDGRKPISEADRLLLFVVTNALNSGMSFESEDQRIRLEPGTPPILLETGTFTVFLKRPRTDGLKVRALKFDGTPAGDLPLKPVPGGVELTLDTAALPNGPAFYFEFYRPPVR